MAGVELCEGQRPSWSRFTISPPPSPHLSPRRGYPLNQNRPVFTVVLSWFGRFAASPISVGFYGSHEGVEDVRVRIWGLEGDRGRTAGAESRTAHRQSVGKDFDILDRQSHRRGIGDADGVGYDKGVLARDVPVSRLNPMIRIL